MKADNNQPQLPAEPHHHIDFRQFFPPPEDILPAPSSQSPSASSTPRETTSTNLLSAGLGGSDWLNLLFVLVTIAGGLLFSIRYFSGPEPFRRATSWPREFLYPRPPGSLGDTKIDNKAALQNPSPDSRSTPAISQPRNSLVQDAKKYRDKSPPRFASNGRSISAPSAQSPTATAPTGSQESARGESGPFAKTKGTGGSARPGVPEKGPPKTKRTPKLPKATNIAEKRVGGHQSPNAHANANNQPLAAAQKIQRTERLNPASTATRIPRSGSDTGGSLRGFNSNRANSFGGGGGGFGGRH